MALWLKIGGEECRKLRVQRSKIWRGCKRLPARLPLEGRYCPPLGQLGRLKCRERNLNKLRTVPPFWRIIQTSGHAYRCMLTLVNWLMTCSNVYCSTDILFTEIRSDWAARRSSRWQRRSRNFANRLWKERHLPGVLFRKLIVRVFL